MAEFATEGNLGLLTLGQIADQLKVSTHRVKYAVDQYRIKPRARVGILRVWSVDAIPLIETALARIAENRRTER